MDQEDMDAAEREKLMSAVAPLLKLLSLTAIGLFLAHPRTQIVPRATFKLLSKLVFALFLPCLIFVHLGRSITSLSDALQWWFVPFNVLLSTAAGCAMGYAVALLCRPPPQFFRLTVIATGFGNTGNIPIAIVGSVCRAAAGSPFAGGAECRRKGVAYVSFAQWISVILVYTLVYHMMEPPLQCYDVDDEGSPESGDGGGGGNLSRPLLQEAEWPGLAEEETQISKTPFIARVFASFTGSLPEDDGGGAAASPKSIRCLAEPKMVRRIRIVAEETPIRQILQPPTVASLLAIVVGTVPALRSFVFGDGGDAPAAPLSFLTDSLEILTGAVVPSVMLVLGGMLAEGSSGESELGTKTTVGIAVARLVVLPVVGIGVVALADASGMLIDGGDGAGDKMYRFVLLLQYTTPSAILLAAIASLRGYAVSEASAILFWQHVCAIFSISLYIVVFFKFL